jgi:hypothetical protein
MHSVAIETRNASDVIGEAERCRREAIEMVRKDPKWSELLNQPSSWCVVIEKGLRPRAFHTMLEQDQLLEKIERGYRVVLTVGLVGAPGMALMKANHVAVISIAEPRKHNSDKLSEISIRARVSAASALHF